MPRPSKIDQLPDEVRDALNGWLRDPAITQEEATERTNQLLEAVGHPVRVSKSGVNRYSLRMEQVGERLRQSRQVAEMWIGKLGAVPQGQMGHLINEILRTLAFDMSLQLQDDAVAAIDPEARAGVISMLKELSLSVMRLERAASENVKREAEIKRQTAEELAAAVEGEAKESGAITPERLREIVRETYGV